MIRYSDTLRQQLAPNVYLKPLPELPHETGLYAKRNLVASQLITAMDGEIIDEREFERRYPFTVPEEPVVVPRAHFQHGQFKTMQHPDFALRQLDGEDGHILSTLDHGRQLVVQRDGFRFARHLIQVSKRGRVLYADSEEPITKRVYAGKGALGAYANTADGNYSPSLGLENNACFYIGIRERQVFLVALRDIEADEAILVSYEDRHVRYYRSTKDFLVGGRF